MNDFKNIPISVSAVSDSSLRICFNMEWQIGRYKQSKNKKNK